MKKKYNADSLAYIDDFGASAGPDRRVANTQFIQLKTLILDLDMTLALDKCAPPSTCMSWIGTTFDSINMCMYIDATKIQETLDFCRQILSQSVIALRQLESLIGRLIYSSKLAIPAKQFMNRILHFRRTMTDTRPHPLPEGVHEDLQWFSRFLPLYNGFSLIRPRSIPSSEVFTDACLVGGGGFCPPPIASSSSPGSSRCLNGVYPLTS